MMIFDYIVAGNSRATSDLRIPLSAIIDRSALNNVRSSKLVETFVQNLDKEDRLHPRSYLEQ